MGRSSDSRRRLIEAAIELMCVRGYGDVGVQELCERAGIKKGSFYHYFPTKGDLTLAALDSLWQSHREHVIQPALAARLSPAERVRRLFDLAFDRQGRLRRTHGICIGCAFGNLAVELSGRDRRIQKRLREIFREWTEAIALALSGTARPPADAEEDAQAILAYLEGLMLLARTHDDPSLVTRLTPHALRLAGMAPPSPASRSGVFASHHSKGAQEKRA